MPVFPNLKKNSSRLPFCRIPDKSWCKSNGKILRGRYVLDKSQELDELAHDPRSEDLHYKKNIWRPNPAV